MQQIIDADRVEAGRVEAALVGGVVGGSLWQLNNLLSVLYVSRVVSNSKVYGSLGLVPVVMIGLYFSWIILLFGAQVAYSFQNRRAYFHERQVENLDQRSRDVLLAVIAGLVLRNRWQSDRWPRLITTELHGFLSLLGLSFPNFALGPVLILLFSIYLGLLPVSGSGTWAHLVLPAAIWGEKEGTYTNSERRVSKVNKAVEPIGEAKSDFDIFLKTAEKHGLAVIEEVEKQLKTLSTEYIAGPAWRDYGSVYLVNTPDEAIEVMDVLAPEHLELLTGDDDYYFARLKNYGSLFIGQWSTVAYADKGSTGTNHVLPTGGGAKYSAGLSVGRFLKPLTYQRSEKSATESIAKYVDVITEYEGMAAHRATATMRLDRL